MKTPGPTASVRSRKILEGLAVLPALHELADRVELIRVEREPVGRTRLHLGPRHAEGVRHDDLRVAHRCRDVRDFELSHDLSEHIAHRSRGADRAGLHAHGHVSGIGDGRHGADSSCSATRDVS